MNNKNDLIATILVVVLAIASVFAAYRYYGERAGMMMIAACGIITYILIRDYRYKKKKKKEEELKRSGGREVISASRSKKDRVDIGNIARRSTKDKYLSIGSENGSEGSDNQAPNTKTQ